MTCGVQLSSSPSCHVIHAEVLSSTAKISLSQSLWLRQRVTGAGSGNMKDTKLWAALLS